MLKFDSCVTDPVWSLLLHMIFPLVFGLTWRMPWHTLEVCRYATKQPVPSRLRKDMNLHFNTSSPCTSARLKSYYLLMLFSAASDISGCGQSLDLLPAHSPHCTSIAVTLSNVHEIKGSGPYTEIVASYTPVQCWGLQHKTLDRFFSNTSWKSMCSK